MGLLNPLLLLGTFLVLVPILIYFFSRRWYRRQEWAAMEFLLRAIQKHRRRLQIENLLLLLIRIAIILFLILAMARPYFRSTLDQPPAEDEEVNWIFGIDTSYSMGYRDGPGTLFDRARGVISDMILNQVKNRDRVAICTLDGEPRIVLNPTTATDSNRAALQEGLGDLSPGTQAVDLARSLEVLRDLASRFEPTEEEAPPFLQKRIVLFSDFQRKDWLGPEGPRDPAVLELIEDIQDGGGAFHLGDLRPSDRNLSILDLSVSPEVIAREVWVQFRATIRNWSREDFNDIELIFNLDGQEQIQKILKIPAGETLTSPWMPFCFHQAGYHPVFAEIRTDGLTMDNRRFLCLRVREDAGILLVDGEPSGNPLDRETLHLSLALSPDSSESRNAAEGRLTPYQPNLRTVDQLEDVDLRENALVVLANVSYLPDRFLESLKSYVREGGALMVFLGKNIDPSYYNRVFSGSGDPSTGGSTDPKSRQGLLPGRIGEILGSSRDSFHLVPGDPGHPILQYFNEHRELTSLLQPIVEFRKFYRIELTGNRAGETSGSPGKGDVDDPDRTMVAFRYSDPEGTPAIFDAGYGMGRVMWINTTADTEWSEFPKWPDFIAFLYEAIPYLVRFGEARINLGVGDVFRQIFDAADYARDCVLIQPGSTRQLTKAMTRLEGENRFAITHEETWDAGIYEIRLSRPGEPGLEGGQESEYFSVNIDPREGDLRPIRREELEEYFPVLKARIFDADRELMELERQKPLERGLQLWREALWLVLILLLTETALAQFFGRRVK